MKRLDEMMGKTYLYKKDNNSYSFLSYKLKGDEVIIVTDKEWFTKHNSEVALFLDWFMPLNTQAAIQVINDNKSHFANIKDIISKNIESVQKDKAYIPQATEVNNQIKSLLEIAKLEIEAMKILKQS